MRISRSWGKDPSWFNTLEREEQETLIAEHTLTQETAKERKSRREAYNRRLASGTKSNNKSR